MWSAYSRGSFRTKLSGPSAIRSANKYSIFRRADNRVVADSPAIPRDLQTAERQSTSSLVNSAELAAFRNYRRLSHRPLKSDTVQLFYASDFAVAIYPPDSTGNSWQSPGVSAESQQSSAPNYQISGHLANKAYR